MSFGHKVRNFSSTYIPYLWFRCHEFSEWVKSKAVLFQAIIFGRPLDRYIVEVLLLQQF